MPFSFLVSHCTTDIATKSVSSLRFLSDFLYFHSTYPFYLLSSTRKHHINTDTMGKADHVEVHYNMFQSWTALIIFSFFSCFNAIQWVTFASIEHSVKGFFHTTTTELNMLSTVFMIIYVVGAIMTCTTFESWGVRRCVLIGSFLNAFGSVLKVAPGLQFPSYLTMIIPQSINGVAQLFVLSTPPLLAAQYFPPNKRGTATTIASMANNIGNALALLVPPMIVRDPVQSQFYVLWGLWSGLSVLIFFGVLFFMSDPPQPMSSSEPVAVSDGKGQEDALVENEEPAPPRGCLERLLANDKMKVLIEVLRTCWTLLKDRDFVFLLFTFSVSIAVLWEYATYLAQISNPYGTSEVLAGISGGGNVVTGTIAAFIAGVWVDHHRRYKWPVVACFVGISIMSLAYILVLLFVPSHTVMMDALVLGVNIIAGIFQNTAIPLCFEFAMEISYPLQESVPGTFLMFGGNLVSIVMLMIGSAILEVDLNKKTALMVVVVTLVFAVAGTITAMLPRERLNRYDAECRERQLAMEGETIAEEMFELDDPLVKSFVNPIPPIVEDDDVFRQDSNEGRF